MTETYRIDVGAILEELGGQVVIDQDVTLDTFVVGAVEFKPAGDAHLDITLINTGAGIVAQGAVSVDLATQCSRCLRDFVFEASGDVEGFYVTAAHAHELPEEQDHEPILENHVDLMPAILSAVTVDLPFAPLHDPDCPGLCPQCGADLSEGACDCAPTGSDSPFSALEGMFDGDDTGH